MLRNLTLTALVAYAAVSTDLYLPAIPQLVADLGATDSQGQLTLSAFLYGFALGQLGYGVLSDYFGRKPLLYCGLSVYAAATVWCLFAGNIEELIGGRFVQGLGAASGPVLARAIVTDLYRDAQAARMMSSLAGAMAVVPALAPVIGSWALLVFDWRAMFGLLLVFCLVTLAGVRVLEESCPTKGQGKLRLVRVVSQFPACLRHPAFIGYVLCGSAIYAAMFTYISTTSFIMIQMLGIPEEQFGYTFLVVVAGYILGARCTANFVTRKDAMSILFLGQGVALCAALLLLVATTLGWQSLPVILLAFFLVFAAGGICLPLTQTGAIALFPRAAGSASSVFGFFQICLAATAGFFVGFFYDGSLVPTVTGTAICVVLSLVGFVLARRSLSPRVSEGQIGGGR